MSDVPALSPQTALDRIAAAERHLESIEDIDAAVNFRDFMDSLEFAAKKMDLSRDIQKRAARLHLYAQRKVGELLLELPKHQGGRPSENPVNGQQGLSEQPPTYAELQITYDHAHKWQTIARVDATRFDEWVAEAMETPERALTTAGAYRFARNHVNKHQGGTADQVVTPTGETLVLCDHCHGAGWIRQHPATDELPGFLKQREDGPAPGEVE